MDNIAEENIGTSILKTLVEYTIDDISYEQMSRIVHRLNRMPRSDRNIPKRVADVLYEELGAAKSLQYVEKAFANGLIKAQEYWELRASLLLPKPREELPPPLAGTLSRQLIEGQRRLQQDFNKLNEAGKQALATPLQTLNKDIAKLRRVWGL